MPQSQVDLYNLALSACGSRDSVALITENTNGARFCNRWYEPVRRHVYAAAHWPTLKRHARLGLLQERNTAADWVSTDPDPGWVYAYSAPNDMVAARHLSTYERFSTGVYPSMNVRAVFCDTEDAILTYTKDETDLSLLDAGLYMCFVYGLAMHIARPLTGKADRSKELAEMANRLIAEARASAANESAGFIDSLPEWISRRGYSGGTNSVRYVAPYGTMFSATGAPVV